MLVQIDRYLRRTGMTKAALGRHALGDPCAIRDICAGRRGLTEYVSRRLGRWMSEYPDGIPPGRPGRPRSS